MLFMVDFLFAVYMLLVFFHFYTKWWFFKWGFGIEAHKVLKNIIMENSDHLRIGYFTWERTSLSFFSPRSKENSPESIILDRCFHSWQLCALLFQQWIHKKINKITYRTDKNSNIFVILLILFVKQQSTQLLGMKAVFLHENF
jgi:hypothetical protein